MSRIASIAAACLMTAVALFITAQPSAAQTSRTFDGVNKIVISEFTGRIVVEIANGPVRANLTNGKHAGEIMISESGGLLKVTGPERPRNYNVHKEIGWNKNRDDAFAKFLAAYPVLTITAPEGVAVELYDPISIATIGDTNGALAIEGGYIDAIAGNIDTGDITLTSSGDIKLGAVRESLFARIAGSGDIIAGSAGEADLSIMGSGDIKLDDIAGNAALNINGSGDIETGDIGGDLSADINGSGDIITGDVAKGGAFSVSGSGDIEARSVHGETRARISGSGDISIDRGRAEDLRVSVAGSGDFDFGGVSTNLHATASGSGSVEVARNEGSMHTSGRGSFRVNGEWIDHDD